MDSKIKLNLNRLNALDKHVDYLERIAKNLTVEDPLETFPLDIREAIRTLEEHIDNARMAYHMKIQAERDEEMVDHNEY